jgi:hypothetical protein
MTARVLSSPLFFFVLVRACIYVESLAGPGMCFVRRKEQRDVDLTNRASRALKEIAEKRRGPGADDAEAETPRPRRSLPGSILENSNMFE